jgi:hypothetical protein
MYPAAKPTNLSWSPGIVGAVSLLIVLFLLSSCADLLEPAPELNTSAHMPVRHLSGINIGGYEPGRHVAGTITLTFAGLPAVPKSASTTLVLGNSAVMTSTASLPSFTFPAAGLPEGNLTLHLKLDASRDPSLGLLNLLDQEAFLSATATVLDTTIPLVIDHHPPTEIQNVRFNWIWNPEISWSPNSDLNFRGYIVRRLQPSAASDTVYNQSQTSYTDKGQLPYLGLPAVYSVSVWNGAEHTTGVDTYHSYGTPWPITYSMFALCPSPVTDEAYGFLGGDTLAAISTATHTVLRRTLFQRNLNGSVPLQGLTPDGSVLYWFDPSDNLLCRVRASDFQPYPTLSIPPPHWADYEFIVTTTRIIEVAWDGGLMLLDASTGKQIGGTYPSFGYGGAIALSADEQTLFGATVEGRLYRFDVGADSFSVTGQTTLPGAAKQLVCIDGAKSLGVVLTGTGYAS